MEQGRPAMWRRTAALAALSVPRRHVLTGPLAAFVVSSLVAASATSYWPLLAARLLTARPMRCSGPLWDRSR
ncbi:hypothetical protein ABZT04_38935 [Streptomyces sp. NPDC005492]|uniref:hypothetical protein n=1 Tax=Streptomyces sp. NPDC005492 TaxID=3156883 RepID=UPI0033A21489